MKKNYAFIKFENSGGVGVITLNRPEVHNAFHFELLNEMYNALTLVKKLKLQILVIRGEGKSFCSGADIKWFSGLTNLKHAQIKKQLKILTGVLWELYNLPATSIAVLSGFVMGGGIGLAAACDFIIGSEKTSMAFREVKLGIIPALIFPYIAARIGINKAKELMLTGSVVNGGNAFNLGLLTHLINEDEKERALSELVFELDSGGKEARKWVKKIALKQNLNITKTRLDDILNDMASIISSPEAKEGFNAFIQKREPEWVVGYNRSL